MMASQTGSRKSRDWCSQWQVVGLVAVVSLMVLAGGSVARAEQDSVRPSVVKIHTTQRFPDFLRPWTKGAPREVAGTGFIIDGKRIVTNAHVVTYPSQIYVQGYQSAEKVPAKVLGISNNMDLAVLAVEDEDFFKERPALELAEGLPKLKASVNVYGYPIGGDQLSVTEGISSRVEYTEFYDASGLRIQIDAALNPGNSGGPAISEGKVIGVAFSGLTMADNIGYLIPTEELRTFLEDVKDGSYQGKPRLWYDFQTTDNDALRAWLKLPKDANGCMVTKPQTVDDKAVLKERDVVTQIGEHVLDRSGQVRLGDELQVMFTYYVPQLVKDGAVPLKIVREGQPMEVNVPVMARRPRVVPYLDGRYPSYFILGPMVFSTPSPELVQALYRDPRWLPALTLRKSPLVTRAGDPPSYPGEELVFVPSPFFSHRLTKGYDNPALHVVSALNGTPVKNLNHLVEMLRDSQDEFLEFTFAESQVEQIVFRRQEMIDATEDILTDNGVRKQFSEDLQTVWEKK